MQRSGEDHSRATLTAALFLTISLSGWFCMPSASADPTWRWDGVARVVAFGDVHGAYRELVSLLQQVNVINESLHWSGGATHLVSLGDLVDRGPDSRAVLDLLMRLQREAPPAGGRVHVVLGNHEVMNLTGDLRYVSAADYTAFADGSASTEVPPGLTARQQAFAATGLYGAWLLQQPAMIVINDTVYMHGGLPGSMAPLGVEGGNARLHDELLQALNPETTDAPGILLADSGPLWYRGTARCHVLLEGERLRQTLDRWSVRRVAIGHTPTANHRVLSRFGGIVVMLDTGMLAEVYRGRPTALVMEGGVERVVVAGSATTEVVEPQIGGYSGEWATSDHLAELLESAPISSSSRRSDIVNGERDVALAGADGPVAARFTPLSSSRARHEVAAYRIDRLLGLGIVPAAAARKIDGKLGVLTLADDGWISERQRRERGVSYTNDCEVGNDFLLMLAFDALIGNVTRTADNLGYDRAAAQLRLRDHGEAFATMGIRRDANSEPPSLPPTLRDRLVALDEQALVEAVGDKLQAREIKAVLARRNTIVESWPILE